jgi:FG-GAP-like repeat
MSLDCCQLAKNGSSIYNRKTLMCKPGFVVVILLSLASYANAVIITGAGAGGGPHVKAFTAGGLELASFFAYAPGFTGGVNVAAGDVDGDGFSDIITGSASIATHVKAFDGKNSNELRSFFAYPPNSADGITVAAGDVNGDGAADIITGAGAGGGPHVKVFDGRNGQELRSFFAYAPGFTGGVNVATGDVDGDGYSDIVTAAGAGGGPHVKVFDGRTENERLSFFAGPPGTAGGLSVAAGDLDGDGLAELITGSGQGGGMVSVFNGGSGVEVRSFFAFDAGFTGGVNVAIGDANGTGHNDIIISAGAGGGPHVKVFDGRTYAELRSFDPYGPGYAGEISVAAPLAVPEPCSVALLAIAGLGLTTVGRRRRVAN